MKDSPLERCIIWFVVLAACSGLRAAEERVIAVARERHRFVRQPSRGYVIKLRQEMDGTSERRHILAVLDADQARAIRGAGRHGIYTVMKNNDAALSPETIASLEGHAEVQYIAPLFSVEGQTVAVIPEIVVRLRAGTWAGRLQEQVDELGLAIRKRMDFTSNEYLLDVLATDVETVFDAVCRLSQVPWVEWAALNTVSSLSLSEMVFPNDEYFPEQWHLWNTGQWGGTPGADINAPAAWEITTGDPNIVVAVLDCGVDSNHPDLVNNLVEGYDFYDDDNRPDPNPRNLHNAHGTSCAGLIAAQGNNGLGITGVAWDCKIMPLRILSVGNNGVVQGCTEADIATAFRWAAARGADILSCSWAAGPSTIIRSAVRDVTAPGGIGRGGKGCIVCVAAGNTGRLIDPFWTKGYPEVIAVGATDRHNVRWSYSGYGPELDLMATTGGLALQPTDIRTTTIGSYRGFGGTSAACAIVAGVAALVVSVDPSLTNLDVQRLLFRSARDWGEPGRDDYYGWGAVDARAAVEMALALPPPVRVCVDDDAPNDPGPGDPMVSDANEDGSADHPFDTIQEAIDRAAPGESVVILPGTYTGHGNCDLDVRGKVLTVRGIDPDDPSVVATTVIDCGGMSGGAHRAFEFHRQETSYSVVADLTMTSGRAAQGAAVFCTDGSSPTFRNCVFAGNAAISEPETATPGGGGAIACQASSPTVQNCIFSDNLADAWGGAIYSNDSQPTIINCTFVRNSARTGGGMWNAGAGSPGVTNCIFRDNTPDQIAGPARISYSDVQGGWAGQGNIDTDPLFADPANGDYHLKSEAGRWDPSGGIWVTDAVTSPCIDAGDPNSDWTAELWPHGQRINMGANGGTSRASRSLSEVGESVDPGGDDSVMRNGPMSLAQTRAHRDVPRAVDLDRAGAVNAGDITSFVGGRQANSTNQFLSHQL